jgi:hypothetical protein
MQLRGHACAPGTRRPCAASLASIRHVATAAAVGSARYADGATARETRVGVPSGCSASSAAASRPAKWSVATASPYLVRRVAVGSRHLQRGAWGRWVPPAPWMPPRGRGVRAPWGGQALPAHEGAIQGPQRPWRGCGTPSLEAAVGLHVKGGEGLRCKPEDSVAAHVGGPHGCGPAAGRSPGRRQRAGRQHCRACDCSFTGVLNLLRLCTGRSTKHNPASPAVRHLITVVPGPR